ncbi:MAG: ATP-binding cassette domain-containing protein [Chloroflexi bacterium]|nr:ATP-binding cassette domain-containing protein [Chloroflexota bacterium]
MDSDIAIRVDGLSKQYRIGRRQERHDTLRDAIVAGAKSFGRRDRDGSTDDTLWALKDVSFEVKRGEVVGVIGRNGAGKSTLLKILSRITEPTAGRAEIHGRVGSLLEVGTGFHLELTGRENIYLNGAILGMRRVEIERKFDEIVAFAEIEKFLDTPVKRYSSGMYVRLAFAVAAHLEPEILLVNEVLAVGDAQFQKKCLGKMGEVAKKGRTVLFVSHNMTAIMALCSRSLLVDAGRIARNGESHDVVQTYLENFQIVSAQRNLRERQDRDGDGVIRVTSLCFGTSNNPQSGFWMTGQDSIVDIGYECCGGRTCRNIEIALGIRKFDQTRLLYLGSKVVRQDLEYVTGAGSSSCAIRRLPLEPGRYLVNVELKQNGIIADHVESAGVVDVADGDYYGTGVVWPYSGFLCDYSWSHDSRSADAAGR